MATADGITGGSITSSGTIKANLKSYTKNTAEIGGKLYGVELDKNGKLAVNVPWTDTHADISNLVPYTGASKDVDLGNHSLLISDKTVIGGGAKIKRSGRFQSEDDTSITIEPGNIKLIDPRRNGFTATLAAGNFSIINNTAKSALTVSGLKVQRDLDTNGDGQIEATNYSTYGVDGIMHNGKGLSLPEKDGTIALTSDLPSKLSQMDNDANYLKSTDNIDADTLSGKTYPQIESMINQKQTSSAFLGLIADTDISNNKTGFLRVYMKAIEAPGTTHYTRVAELQDLPLASSSEYGMVKLGSDAQQSTAANSVSSAASRTYAIQKDSSGNLVVNVPWISQSYTLPDASSSTKGGVKAIFGVTSGGEGNFELYADIQQGNNTLYIRAGQFQQTSGSSSSSTRFTFKRAMNTMGGSASYVAVILGDSYGQSTNGQWMGSLAVDGSDYGGFKYRAANSEKGHVYYIGIGRW